MDRRNFLFGTAALPATMLLPEKNTGWITVKNKEGIPVEMSKSLVEDVWKMHQIDAPKLIRNSYGTSYSINKEPYDPATKHLYFHLKTNDRRDLEIKWAQRVEN